MDGFEVLRRVARDDEAAVFLDGVMEAARTDADRELRQWSAVAARPAASLAVLDGVPWYREPDGPWRPLDQDPWDALRAFAREGESDPLPGTPWPHGVVGLATYDAGRLIERIPERARDDTGLPQLLFHRFDAAFVQHAGDDALLHHARGAERIADDLRARLANERVELPSGGAKPPISARTPQKDFERMVLLAKEHVARGEVFQVNLSHRLETTTTLHPIALYARLREANPAPFSAYFASGPLPEGREPFFVLSSSPERLFRVASGRLEARPIAGTRRRGATPEEDAALVTELRGDAKEQAEHVMLVDLARNDLGRVARYGSVRVPKLLTVESYRTVHHLVSVVEADLAEGKDAVDALVALFPGGTITGAPKVRAMEVIEELEPVRRGVYTGSLGWIAPGGDADFNILIRTLLVQDGRVHLQAGAGIVEESVPEREYHETLAKAKGLLRALGEGDA